MLLKKRIGLLPNIEKVKGIWHKALLYYSLFLNNYYLK